MTKDQDEALEKCVKAILREERVSTENWNDATSTKDFAKKMVICLDALGLLNQPGP